MKINSNIIWKSLEYLTNVYKLVKLILSNEPFTTILSINEFLKSLIPCHIYRFESTENYIFGTISNQFL